MLLNALLEPEVQQQTSAYVTRAGEVAGTFLYGVAIMSVVIFFFAVLASMRVSPEPPK
ncbi:MAG TPA: hypothetical protein VF997_24025 [Polyangia bacterium]